MSQATNLQLKDAENNVVLFTLAAPAAGTSPAVWFNRLADRPQGVFPKVEFSARKNAAGDARKSRVTISLPQKVTDVNGVVRKGGTALVDIEVTMPDSIPDVIRGDVIAYASSLLAEVGIVSSLTTGYAPT